MEAWLCPLERKSILTVKVKGGMSSKVMGGDSEGREVRVGGKLRCAIVRAPG